MSFAPFFLQLRVYKLIAPWTDYLVCKVSNSSLSQLTFSCNEKCTNNVLLLISRNSLVSTCARSMEFLASFPAEEEFCEFPLTVRHSRARARECRDQRARETSEVPERSEKRFRIRKRIYAERTYRRPPQKERENRTEEEQGSPGVV